MDIWKSLDGMVEAELTSAEPGAALYYGFARAVSRDEIEKSLAENTLIDLLRRGPGQPGGVFFIPPRQ